MIFFFAAASRLTRGWSQSVSRVRPFASDGNNDDDDGAEVIV